MTEPLFSLRYQHPTATHIEQTRIEGWLQRWGTAYLRDITWRAYDPNRDESFRFRLDFVIFPIYGRKPSDYLLLELISPQPDPIAKRDAARRQLLRVLWPGQMWYSLYKSRDNLCGTCGRAKREGYVGGAWQR